uniref:Dual specificity phosphatase n=2 Tax=Wuchereria bancrofti TaxID=6293 RepID=A0A1I8F013_WUCBA
MPFASFQINPVPEYDEITELIPQLYICGASSLTLNNMNKYNISLIINATTEVPSVRSLGSIPRIKLWLDDTPSTNIYQYFDLISDQIETMIASGGNVLVHCVAGISRSATICLAFLTKFCCKSLRQAYQLMAQKRPFVRPNIGFWRQLIIYEHLSIFHQRRLLNHAEGGGFPVINRNFNRYWKRCRKALNRILRKMSPVSFNVNPEYAQITEIVRGLFICGVSSLTAENMKKYDISFIVNATNEVPNVQSLGNIPRVKLWLEDTPQASIYPLLDQQTDQIEAVIASGGNVLVHCVAGISRSAAICLAFLTKFRCKSLRQAYQLMAQKRPVVKPNIGFWRQLIAYEQDIKQSVGTIQLIRDKTHLDQVIPDVYLDKETGFQKLSFIRDADEYENGCNCESRNRRNSGARLKFRPVLEPVLECVEATA